MATRAVKITSPSPDAGQALVAMRDARERTLALVAGLDDGQLERVHSPIMSPLVWDLGHIAAYEDLWLAHRHGGLELLRPDLADLYDAFETPRAVRGEIEALGPAEAKEYMAAVSARTAQLLCERGLGDGVLCEMVTRHELQHSETMRQTMAIAGLLEDTSNETSNAVPGLGEVPPPPPPQESGSPSLSHLGGFGAVLSTVSTPLVNVGLGQPASVLGFGPEMWPGMCVTWSRPPLTRFSGSGE